MIYDYFTESLKNMPCNKITNSYIVGIFKKYKTVDYDFSNENITLLYARSVFENDFESFQNLADWLFFLRTLFPEFLKNASEDYYNNIAQISYYKCYKFMRTWKVYEELADQFVFLTAEARKFLKPKMI